MYVNVKVNPSSASVFVFQHFKSFVCICNERQEAQTFKTLIHSTYLLLLCNFTLTDG